MGKEIHHTINYAELKQLYIDATSGKRVAKRVKNQEIISRLVDGWKNDSSFYGVKTTEVVKWLRDGYRQEGLTLNPPVEPIRKRRRIMYAEEGELQLDLAWSGHDYPFLQWTKRETMPGMRCNIYANFQAGTKVDIIQQYYRFCLRALIALENSGIDLEVWISSDSIDIFGNGDRSDKLFQHVEVKKEGEQTDYLGWSAMVSPGGYRHLFFLEHVIGCDRNGRDSTHGLGRGMNMYNQGWECQYDIDERQLTFRCPWHPKEFPDQEMEFQLRDVILNARKVS